MEGPDKSPVRSAVSQWPSVDEISPFERFPERGLHRVQSTGFPGVYFTAGMVLRGFNQGVSPARRCRRKESQHNSPVRRSARYRQRSFRNQTICCSDGRIARSGRTEVDHSRFPDIGMNFPSIGLLQKSRRTIHGEKTAYDKGHRLYGSFS